MTATPILSQFVREHRVYDGADCTQIYRTDENNAIDSGYCQITVQTYTSAKLLNSYTYNDYKWSASWNVSKL